MGELRPIACELQANNLWIASIPDLALHRDGKIDSQSRERRCGTAFALPGGPLDLLGDRWTLLVVRDWGLEWEPGAQAMMSETGVQ